MTNESGPQDFGFGSEEEMLRDLVRKFLDENFSEDRLRELVAGDSTAVYEQGRLPDWDSSLWREMVELGWSGLAVPESAGGVGFKLVGIAALVEEAGRHALPSPLLSTLGATMVLKSAEEGPSSPWLERIAEGASATLAITDSRGSWEPTISEVQARIDGDEILLSGTASFVQDAFKADLLLVSARCDDVNWLCVVPSDQSGVHRIQDHIHDLTRDQARVKFDDVRLATENVVSHDGARVLAEAWPSLLVLLAADLCGVSEWQLQATSKYARERKQFDRPLGFFQAVKHSLVDAMIGVDRARSLLFHAACCVDQQSDEAEQAARMAKSAASDAAAYVSNRSVQLHGGVGFTWESTVHIFFKRSMHGQTLLGDGVHQRRKLALELIGPLDE